MSTCYEPHLIRDNFYEIANGSVRCFLIIGKDFSLLIDSGYGGNLRSIIEEITKLPVKVIHTHSDRDHIGASAQFDELYMHPSEYAFCTEQNNITLPLRPIWDGDCIEVGDYCLEVILIPGHTPGSIALLDRKHRLLISGDSVQSGTVYMYGKGRNIRSYEMSLRRLQDISAYFDTIYPCHGNVCVPVNTVSQLLALTSEINRGDVPEPQPAPEHLPENVKVYSKYGVQLFLQLDN